MSSLNKVMLIGNLTRDPELRSTPKGTPVGEFGIAINSKYKTQDGTEREEVTYVDIVTWGRQAETCNDYLSKGRPVFIEGRLQLDQWEDKESGQKRSKMRVRAERVQFLGGGKREDGEGYRNGGGSSERPSSRQTAPARDEPSFDDVDSEDIPF